MKTRAILRVLPFVIVAALAATSCGSSSDDESAGTDTPSESTATDTDQETADESESEPMLEGELIGLFSIDPTACSDADVTGSYFRMIQPEGSLDTGPFVPNADSACADSSYSALSPGSDGGLLTGTQQLPPDVAFDDAGNGVASGLVEPVKFFGVDFALAIDGEAAVPTVTAVGDELSGDLSAWTAYYANLVFNQGAPKPDGTMPGLTSDVTGTIDPETGAYMLEWSSEIVGGSFNEFTGVWHLEGTFTLAG
ncbi:MAG: hypothetical protein OEU32_12585 [Acidimicrobiia bacterium]|nr:hypothetical protein [Acidimicrobiia bacterium]